MIDVGAVVGAAAQLRGRLGEDREAGGARRGGRAARAARGRAGARRRSRRSRPRAMCLATSSSRKAEGSRSIGVTAVSGRPSRPSSASGSVAVTAPSTGSGASGSRQGRLRWTGPGRGSPRAAAKARQASRAVVQQPVVVGLVRADFAEPAHRGAVELQLVDRLPGADPAQLRRAVGGQRDQRHAPTRRPRRSPGGSWRRRCPRCRASPPARRSPAPRPARRRRRSARRRSPSPRSPAGARAPPPAASSASRGRGPRAAARSAPAPRRRRRRARCWRWSGPSEPGELIRAIRRISRHAG